jgi:hypothetical protein
VLKVVIFLAHGLSGWDKTFRVFQAWAKPWLFFCSLGFEVCSLSGSNNQMRLVGTVKRIVVVLRVSEQLSLEPKNNQLEFGECSLLDVKSLFSELQGFVVFPWAEKKSYKIFVG